MSVLFCAAMNNKIRLTQIIYMKSIKIHSGEGLVDVTEREQWVNPVEPHEVRR